MSYFIAPYTIHFDDTMAYGSHHFLTGFKFQCAGRESLLYGELIFDRPGVPEALEKIHLFTADAYCRNLSPAYLGDRLAIVLTLEEWGLVSARFCYRVLGAGGKPICAGFQTHVCADAKTGNPMPFPDPVREAYDAIREITEAPSATSFRDRVLSGGDATQSLFPEPIRAIAREYLVDRYGIPKIVRSAKPKIEVSDPVCEAPLKAAGTALQSAQRETEPEVWVFPGQGAFDAELLCERITRWSALKPQIRSELEACASLIQQHLGGDAGALLSGDPKGCLQAVVATPDLSQIGIYLQGVAGAELQRQVSCPAVLMGHSLGEIAALTAAGSLGLREGVLAVCQRVRAVREHGPAEGGLLVAMTDRPTVAEEIALLEMNGLVIAGRNHDRQTVVSGTRGQLEGFSQRLRQLGIDSISIPSPTSFHHPSLRSAATAWLRELKQLRFSPPSAAIYSPIGRRSIGENDDIATLLSTQFLRPFDLQGAIDDLVMVGLKRFVDCGSSGVLERLLRAAGPDSIEVVGPAARMDATRKTSPKVNGELCPTKVENTVEVIARTEVAKLADKPKSTRPTIAIVGQGCLLPGRASSPAALHNTIMQGRSGIVDLRRMDADWERDFYSERLTADRSTSALAGMIDDRDVVCPENVDPGVFEQFSRAQKLLAVALAPCLESLVRAGDNARLLCLIGATADGFQDQDVVAALRYAGVDPTDPQIASRIEQPSSAHGDPYHAIRQVFDSLVRSSGLDIRLIDAACASSLYSVGLGMAALENHDADIVVAGGVYCPGPGNNCLFSQFGGLTATGCRPFDAKADGVVFSEGAALLVMRRLEDARRLGEQPVAIIRGVGLSSDGRSPSANVPQSAGQLIAVRRCYENYDIAPASITAIEGHGTSTPAGDSTEIDTMRSFFSDYVQSPIPLHSLKGAIGHTGWAAGVASILAASEILRTKQFPAQLNFHQPSSALRRAEGVLRVSNRPLRLSATPSRIAIDGFGFGGANAHLVVESIEAVGVQNANTSEQRQWIQDNSELVVVGWHQLTPDTETNTTTGDPIARFDRTSRELPGGVVMLPDLADDMDVTQRLALRVVAGALPATSNGNALRTRTSVIMSLQGKTERGIEATLRVLAPRLSRQLTGLDAASRVENAARRSRPSGPYTLQCMMPNVSSGRAALQFDLKGPNFVVDAGPDSLEAAFESAAWLLRRGESGGTDMAIVTAIHANRWPAPNSDTDRCAREYAAAFAVTRRSTATRLGLNALSTLDALIDRVKPNGNAATQQITPSTRSLPSTAQKLDSIIESLSGVANNAEAAPERVEPNQFTIHAPTWIEAPLPSKDREMSSLSLAKSFGESHPDASHHGEANTTTRNDQRWLVIVRADETLIHELLGTLPELCRQHYIVVVGPNSHRIANDVAHPDVRAWDVGSLDEGRLAPRLAEAKKFSPHVVVAVQRPTNWDLPHVLSDLTDNSLCEAVFLVMKQLAAALQNGEAEVWGAFPQSFQGNVHPCSGAVVGLLRAAKREMPASRFGAVFHRDGSLRELMRSLQKERNQPVNDEQEIVYDGNRRLVQRLRNLSMEAPLNLETAWHGGHSRLELDRNSVVIASGGARGVTAVMVESLLRDYGCTVIALGRSPLEPGPEVPEAASVESEFYSKFMAEFPHATAIQMKQQFKKSQAAWEAHRRLTEFAGLPGRVRYVAIDVTDQAEVDSAIAGLVAELGRIDLIVHGAGVQYSKRLESRKLSEFRQTYDIKIRGLYNLVSACNKQTGQQVPVHALTSAYSIFGNDGQHDYGAANITLDRLCQLSELQAGPGWSSLAWSAWNGVGMTRGSEYQALAARRNLALLEPPEGQRLFRSVIEGKWEHRVHVPLSEAERTRYRVRTLPPYPAEKPSQTIEIPIPIGAMKYLTQHRIRGVTTLPGAWIIERMVRAVLDLVQGPVQYVTLENIRFDRFVRVGKSPDPAMRVIVDKTPNGFAAWLVGNVVSSSGVDLASDQVFAQATLTTHGTRPPISSALNDPSIKKSDVGRFVDDPYCKGDQNVSLSGPFDCLRKIEIALHGRRALFVPRVDGAWDDVIPALLLDASLRVAGMHLASHGLHVPVRIDRVTAPVGVSSASLGESGWVIRAAAPTLDGDDIRSRSVEVCDQFGELRARIDGSLMTRLR